MNRSKVETANNEAKTTVWILVTLMHCLASGNQEYVLSFYHFDRFHNQNAQYYMKNGIQL